MSRPFTKISKVLLTAGTAMALAVTAGPLFATQGETAGMVAGKAWKFRVFLDDEEIGFHHFYLAKAGDTHQLRSVADFEYKLLFIPVYQYTHENMEIWNEDCLQSINSQTDANGDSFQVEGRLSKGEFRVTTLAGEQTLPECVMSFAYWNPAFIGQPRLLNSQDGKFMDVDFLPPVLEELEVQGNPRPAWRHGLAAGELKMNLWYSDGGEWLGLESEVRGGRKLRYALETPVAGEFGEPDLPRTATLDSATATSRKGK